MSESLNDLYLMALRLAGELRIDEYDPERAAHALAARADATELHNIARLISRAARIAPPPPPSSSPAAPLEFSGEARVVRALAPFRPRVAFDVGANVGNWTALALEAWPECQIHSFEIVPTTFARLRDRFARHARVTTNPFGLFDADGPLDINIYEGYTALSSFAPYPHAVPSSVMRCEARRGDGYAAQRGIETIDYIKIDVEGAEFAVLQGLGPLLTGGAIQALQFEYGQVNILTHRLLVDFHFSLTGLGYKVGKIGPGGVRFAAYSFADEDFELANFIAVREARGDVIAALSAPG